MPKTKISEYSATANSNTDVASINIDEGCAPSGINNAIRAVMGHLKDFQQGTNGDPFNGPVNGTVGATTPASGAFTTLSASSTVTLSGGTANGVAYLNGSKVLTTGSALVFDGTNLGVGVTPSAWGSRKALEVGNAGSAFFSVGANQNYLTSNSYFDGAFKYGATGTATAYQQFAGTHAWLNATSGSAGGVITFTQAMTLDASGNLLVGATSSSGNGERAHFNRLNATKNQPIVSWSDGQDNTGFLSIVNSVEQGVENGAAISSDTALFFGRMISGTFTERARIDSSGNLLVGTTTRSASERFNATNAADTSQAIIANATSSNFNGDVLLVRATRNTTNSTFAAFSYYNDGAAAYKLRIWDSGNVVNTNNSYGSLSDVKIKENIVDASPKLDDLMQVKVRNYNLIGDTAKQLGVVAQELEQVFPGMIDESPDRDADGNDLGTTTKSVKYSVFVPMLIKAIQEQQALITQLTARITALESA